MDVPTNQLIERAHLALIRHDNAAARSLLQQVLDVEPGHREALTMLARIEPVPQPIGGAPNWGGVGGSLDDGQGLPDPDLAYSDGGEKDRMYAAIIANEADREECLRLRITPPPSIFAAPTPKWMMWLRLAGCIALGQIVMFMPGRHNHVSFTESLNLSTPDAILIGLVFGVIIFAAPPRHRHTWWL